MATDLLGAAEYTAHGDLGSEYSLYRRTPEQVRLLALSFDALRAGCRRALFDVAEGVILLMTPSRAHEVTKTATERVLDALCAAAGVDFESFGATRLRRPDDPPNTGPEPDAAFYIGPKAAAYAEAAQGQDPDGACDQFVMENPPDLLVEVEATHADEHKMAAYQRLGVGEVWRIQGTQSARNARVHIWKLTTAGYRCVPVSPALGLRSAEIAQLVNAPEKNPLRTDSAYAQAVRSAARKVLRRIEEVAPPSASMAQRSQTREPPGEDAGGGAVQEA